MTERGDLAREKEGRKKAPRCIVQKQRGGKRTERGDVVESRHVI